MIARSRAAVREYVGRYARARVSLLAASLAYYATFSLFPLILLGVAGFGFALRANPAFEGRVESFLADSVRQVFPTGAVLISDVLGEVRGGVLERLRLSAGVNGLIGLVSLVWAASGFFTVLQSALTLAVPGRRSRSVVAQRVVAMVSVVTLGPLVLLLMLAGAVVSSVATLLAGIPELREVAAYSGSAVTAVGAVVLFSLSYRFLPAHNPSWRAAVVAALPTAAAWQVARSLLTVFTPRQAYEATYGAATGFLLLLAWLYLSMQILLAGGVLAGMLDARRLGDDEERAEAAVAGWD